MASELMMLWVRDQTNVPGTALEIITEDSIVITTEDDIDIVTEGE